MFGKKNEEKSEEKKDEKVEEQEKKSASKFSKKWEKKTLFGKVVFIVTSMILFCGINAWLFDKTISKVMVVLQLLILFFSWLIKEDKICLPQKWIPNVMVCVSVVLFIPFFYGFTAHEDKDASDFMDKETIEDFDWEDNELMDLAPELTDAVGYIDYEKSDEISVCVIDYDKKAFSGYKNECIKEGFVENSYEKDNYYKAENEDGYIIILDYSSEKEVMRVNISKPILAVVINLTCEDINFAKKYELIIRVDKMAVGAISKKGEDTIYLELTQGVHELEVESRVNSDYVCDTELDIKREGSVDYTITFEDDELDIE